MRFLTPQRRNESLWDFMSDMERAFDDVWRTPRGASTATNNTPARPLESFTPAVDLHETADFYLVSVDLPGVNEKDIRIDVTDGRLSVTGERTREHREDQGLFRRFERSYGKFERIFALPQDVNADKIQARFENGVLEVIVPKAEVTKPRSIEINKEKGGLFSRTLSGNKAQKPEGEGSH